MTGQDTDTLLVCLLAADLDELDVQPAVLLTPEQARAHARERAAHATAKPHDHTRRPDGSPCKGKEAARALAALLTNPAVWSALQATAPDLLRQGEAALAPFDVAKLLGRS